MTRTSLTNDEMGVLLRHARDKALLEAEKAVNDRLAAYGLHREKHRSAIAATHMAALAVRRIRIGETPTVYQEFEVVPAGALLAERERCAQIADDYDQAPGDDTPMGPLMAAQAAIAQTIAERIRKGFSMTPDEIVSDYMEDRPRRRVVMLAKIEADDWEGLQSELKCLATEIAIDGRLSRSSCSGGYSTGHIIVTSEDGSIDHDAWAIKLDEHLKRLDERG